MVVLAGCGDDSQPSPTDASPGPAPQDAPAVSDATPFDDAPSQPGDAMAPDGAGPLDANPLDSGPVAVDAAVPPGDFPFVGRLGSRDSAFLDQFGMGLALFDEGQTLAVGGPNHDHPFKSAGAVYLFRRSGATWDPFDKLEVSAVAGALLGWSIAAADGVLVVGAPGSNTVHVYEQDASGRWREAALLTPPAPGPQPSSFGLSVAVDGNIIVVGGYEQPDDASPGHAAVFEKQGDVWKLQAELRGSDGHSSDSFGYATSLHGDQLFVSANGHKDKGAVYEFHRGKDGAWQQVAMIVAPDAKEQPHPSFGSSLAAQGDLLAVGAPGAFGLSPWTGAAYLFRKRDGRWEPISKLVDPDGFNGDGLGQSIEIVGSHVFVGSILAIAGASWPGSVLVFTEGEDGTWSPREELFPSTATGGDRFGSRLSVSGGLLAVSAVREAFSTVETGVVHLLDVSRAAAVADRR